MKKIAIIDYSIGNLFSVNQAIHKIGLEPFITNSPAELKKADGVILPGVGAYNKGMARLVELGLDIELKNYIKSGKPFMGICLGMQLLLNSSEEFGITKGLGIIAGDVKKLKIDKSNNLTVPRITWDEIYPDENSWDLTPLRFIDKGADVYFVHSFYCDVSDKKSILSVSKHGEEKFCSTILKENVFATQYHPEKSGKLGLQIYQEWKKLYL